MKRTILLFMLGLGLILLPLNAMAATEQAKQQAIDEGLAYLAGTMAQSATEGWFSYINDGTLAATASAALAFIEEGYLPGTDFVDNNSVNHGDVVGKMVNYIFNRGKVDTAFGVEDPGQAYSGPGDTGYERYAEDYNNDGNYTNDGGNNQAIFFDPAYYKRDIYTNGIVAPVIHALGEALGRDTVVGRGSAVVSGMTYSEVMRDLVDWYSWGQVEPDRGDYRGGWRYTPNYSSSDNSTAQWGALTLVYGQDWGLDTPDYVLDELKLWTDVVQNNNGGSGYSYDGNYVNVSKTGGLLAEFALMGYAEGVDNSTTPKNTVVNEVDAAMNFINGRWNNGPYSTWYGNLGHPYAMWAVYKGMELYGNLEWNDNGTPGDTSDDFRVGTGMTNAAGGITIGQDWNLQTSASDDWYSHYCDWLVNAQNPNGSWNGYSYWTGALAAGWNINILNATGAPPPVDPVPEPATMLLLGTGLIGLAGVSRRKKK